MLKLVYRVAALLLPMLGTAPALAAGTAVGVDPDAEARGRQTRTLVVGADIFIGDRIVTDARGLVQILFEDKTRLVVGPRSSLVIEDYLLRENGSAGRFAVNALSGTFRFITGGAPKDRYVITTPTGQIGVRGTAFDLYVTKSATYLLQLHGATINCSRSGACETQRDTCGYSEISRGGVATLEHVRELEGEDRQNARAWFRFATSQSPLLRQFRVSGAERCMRGRPAQVQTPGSLSDPRIVIRPRNDDDNGYDYENGDGSIFD